MTGGFRGRRSTARLVPWIVLLGATLAAGQEIPLGTAPTNPPQAGFAVTVLTERLGGEGFQPITLRFRATGPAFTRRRRLRVLFRPRNRYATHVDFQFSCGVTLPESAKAHDVRVLVPHIYRWETCSLHLIENGRPIDRRPTQLAIPAAAKDWGQHVSVGILLPRDAATSKQPWARFPDVRGLVTVLGDGPIPSDPAVRRQSDKEARDFVKQLQAGRTRFRLLEEDDLEASWLGYSQLDLILVPFPTLKRIETEQPQRMAELQKWLSTGTQIWTYGVSGRLPDWLAQTVPDAALASQFQADPSLRLRLAEVNDESPLQYQPWNFGSFYSGGTSNSGELRQSVYEKLKQARHPLAKTIDRKTFLAEVDAVRYGLGRVVLIGEPDPFPGSFSFWFGLDTGLQWTQRQGVRYAGGNDSYWAWLMSTVGMPPVTAFVILNGLFVLVMGPVLYFALRRRGRLYLLYFLAPALALGSTSGLFVYAFVSDGFANRGRVRQLSWFDGRQPLMRRGDAAYPIVDQSRQTFYSVIDNAYGLRYDDQTLVLPVFHSELMENYRYQSADHDRPGDYRIDQIDDQQIYGGDFLPIRTQVHHLATRPSVASAPISVRTKDAAPALTNHLSTSLSAAVVCDADGKYWTVGEVPAGATVLLRRSQGNPFPQFVRDLLEPATSDLPAPFQSRINTSERSELERRMKSWATRPEPGSFCVRTAVQPDRLPLRDCVLEDSGRLIGGYLP